MRSIITFLILAGLSAAEAWAWNEFRQHSEATISLQNFVLALHVGIALVAALAASLWLPHARISTRLTLAVWFFILAVILPVAGVPVVAALAWILASTGGNGLRPEDRYVFGNPPAHSARRESRQRHPELRTLTEAMRSFSAAELENMIQGLRHLQPPRLALHFLRRFQIDRKSNLQFAAQGVITAHLEKLESQLKTISSRLTKNEHDVEARLAAAEILLDLAAWAQEGDATALVFRNDALRHLEAVPADEERATRLRVIAQLGLRDGAGARNSLAQLQTLTHDPETLLAMQTEFIAGNFLQLPLLATPGGRARAEFHEPLGFWSGELNAPTALHPKAPDL